MKIKFHGLASRITTLALSAVLVFSGLSWPNVAYAAELSGVSTTVSAPGYNAANIPAMDTTGTVAYWYAGNKFLALNQFNGGADPTQASKSITIGSTTTENGKMPIYTDGSWGYLMQETTSGDASAITTRNTGTAYTNEDPQTFVQSQDDSFFDTDSDGKADVWELMDSDAVWDDDYLFAQYQTRGFDYTTSTFAPSILTNVNGWYENGFSYPSGGGGAAISAQGKYFSEAEQNAVVSASITTDGVGGSSNTSSNDTLTAHLFAPSLDEIYYNPQQVKSIFDAFSADNNAGRTANTSWQYPRSDLWLRSFWGVGSGNSHRLGVYVCSTGQLHRSDVAYEFAVAPAFYLDTKGVVMAKDASNAAATAAASASKKLSAYNAGETDDNKSVKFLISDPTFASGFSTGVSQRKVDVFAGDTYTISYTGADTSTDSNTDAGNQDDSALVISAIIYDNNGKILYYGPLDTVSSANGTVDLTIPALADGTYTLAVFEEQLGGSSVYNTSGGGTYTSYESDYQSGSVSLSTLVVGSGENATGFDSETWYDYNDTTAGILWKYKLNADGDVIGLYTQSSSITGIIDSGKCLNVPAKINGRTVIGIGGESSEHPFIPASQKAWTSISFPSTLTTINDYAFLGSLAPAKIVIPSNITAIGIKAFYDSNITQVVLSEFNGRIGSYAFAGTANLSTVTIKGGEKVYTAVDENDISYTGLFISSATFANSGLTDLSVTGNVTMNKKAFVDCTKLGTINLNGNIKLNSNVFSGCTSATNLYISGTVDIGSYAFNGCTSLKDVYLPVGTTVSEYSFNGCTGITSLEADCNLPSHSFEGTGNISLIILDLNCLSVAYDWEGNHTNFAGETTATTDGNGVSSLSSPGRTVYARNAATQYNFYGKDGTYLSPFGASGTVQAFIPYDIQYNTDGSTRTADENGILTLYGITLENYSTYDSFKNADDSTYVYVTSIGNIDTMMDDKGVTALANSAAEKKQTGINAYYSGTILTTKDIDKSKMTVTRLYGAEEGDAYSPSEFYVVRTDEEFEVEKKKTGGVTEENIAAYEPVFATDEDLDAGQKTGTISATVVVFYEETTGTGDSVVTTTKYYSTPVSIRVEEYTAKSYIEQKYGSYDAVAAAFVAYEDRIKELEDALKDADVDSIDALSKELASCKAQYADLVELLASYVSDNTTDDTGYFGKTVGEDGTEKDVVFIEGNPTEYSETPNKDDNGNIIYSASYDADGNGEDETIYFTVDSDGVHLVDQDGNPVKADGTEILDGESGTVYSDKLGSLQRQLTYQINDLKGQLDDCDSGLEKVKASITQSDIDFSTVEGDTDYEKIANVIDGLSSDLADAQTKIGNYAAALNTIYNKLTGEDLSEEDAASLSSALTAITGKIGKVKSDLSVAQATVDDLKARLADAESEVTRLSSELETTRTELEETEAALEQAQTDLETAKSEKEQMIADYQKALADGDEEAAANLKAQIEEKDKAISELEQAQADLENTKSTLEQKEQDLEDAKSTVELLKTQIQEKDDEIDKLEAQLEALSSTAEGYTVTVAVANSMFGANLSDDATADQISAAVNNFVKTKTENEDTLTKIQNLLGTTLSGDELVSYISDRLESGTGTADYTGYTKDTDVNKASSSYKSGYDAGYADGQKAGDSSSDSSSDTRTYADGYSAGYSAGQSSVDTSSNSTTYKNGYNEGYTAGVKASSGTSSNSGASYSNGYSAGYSAGVNSVNTSTYYNSGYSAGVASVDTSSNSTTYKNGYNAGYTAGKNTASTSANGSASSGSGSTTASSTAGRNNTNSTTASASSNSANGTANGTNGTNSTNSTNDANKPNAVDEDDDILLEGSTVGINATPSGTSTAVTLGTVVERKLPTDAESSVVGPVTGAGTTIVYSLNDTDNPAMATFGTNTESFKDATVESKNNAYKLIEYYRTHLDELRKLGSKDIAEALTDDTKSIDFDVVKSIDVVPSEVQKNAMSDGEKVDLKLYGLETGELYLVIHESTVRNGVFDVALSKAAPDSNGLSAVSMKLEDLSPVTICKISISSKTVEEKVITENPSDDGNVDSPESLETVEEGHSNAWLVWLLVIVAVGALVFLFIQIKKRGGFDSFKK